MLGQNPILALQMGLFCLEDLLGRQESRLEDLSGYLPGWIHFNRPGDMALKWMSAGMEAAFGVGSAEAAEQGAPFLQQRIHYRTTARVLPLLNDLWDRQDFSQVIGFVQLIRSEPGRPYQPYYTAVKISSSTAGYLCQVCMNSSRLLWPSDWSEIKP